MQSSGYHTPQAWWPKISDTSTARSASRQGFWAAVFVAATTAFFAILALAGTTMLGLDGWALVDAALFSLIAVGIRAMSRVAAVAGLVLFLAEKANQFSTDGPKASAVIISLLLLLAFIHGVRGTFAFHAYRSPAAPTKVIHSGAAVQRPGKLGRRLNGWQRLWVVASLVWLVVVGIIAVAMMPSSEEIRNARVSELEQLSRSRNAPPDEEDNQPEPLVEPPVQTSNSDASSRGYLSTDPQAGEAIEQPRALGESSSEPLQASNPDASAKVQIADLLDSLEASLRAKIETRYQEKMADLWKERARIAGTAFLVWCLPALMVYVLGLAVAWIVRGFRTN